MNKTIFILGVFYLAAVSACSTNWCDTLRSLANRKRNAYEFLCEVECIHSARLCDDIQKHVENFNDSYAALCLNSTENTCNTPNALGMENKIIPDSAVTASSEYSSSYRAPYARLKRTSKCSWAPTAVGRINSWLQVDLGTLTIVTGVATQGSCYSSNEWTKTYEISYSTDGRTWSLYSENGVKKILDGNSDKTTVVTNTFSTPIKARYIRFLPKTWSSYPTTRIEYYGCPLKQH